MDPLTALTALGGPGDASSIGGYAPMGLGAALNRLGGPMGLDGAMMQQFNMQQYLIGMLMGLMVGQSAGLGGAGAATSESGIAPGGLAGVPLFNNGGGANAPTGVGNTGNTGTAGGVTPSGNSGSDAVELGRKFIGQNSADIKGKLPKFTAAGGQTNNCADFVSSLLESTGKLQGHHVNVKSMEQALIKQGWRRIPASQAKPGDVWMNHSRGHVELVTAAGGTRTIGSNNDRPGHQVISERNKDPNSGIYYTK